jgi:4-amino-4-deoxy-L-arabinose transferase-like glycosyltransferase
MTEAVHDTHAMSSGGRIALTLILLVSAVLNLWNNQFPLGYHGDEVKKTLFIQTGTQDFHHPILMLQLTRIANLAIGFQDPQKVAVLGRSCSALAGVGIVYLSYWLARQILPLAWALLAALAVAVSPTLVIHAHYFKEDVVFTVAALLSLAAFIRFVRRQDAGTALQFGVALGLAMAGHYKSLLLVPVFGLFPLFGPVHGVTRCYAHLTLSLLVAASIFLAVNWPLLESPDVFLSGVRYEAGHVLGGHTLQIGPLDYWFGFHFWFSLIPGMSPAVVALGLWQIAWAAWNWTRVVWEERLMIAYVVVIYAASEISPLKPEPDFGRYVLPLVPVLICLACRGAYNLPLGTEKAWPKMALLAVVIGYCVVDSVLLDYYMMRDTRAAAAEWLAGVGQPSMGEHYSGINRDVWSLADLNLNDAEMQKVRYLVASSFMYERYLRGQTLRGQDPSVYAGYRQYEKLFEHPYVEFRPAYKSFAFSNPTIRIIDLQAEENRGEVSPP